MKIERWDILTTAIHDLRGIAKETGIIDITDIEIEVGFGSWDGDGVTGTVYVAIRGDNPDVAAAELARVNVAWEERYPGIGEALSIETEYRPARVAGAPTWVNIPTSTQVMFTVSSEDA